MKPEIMTVIKIQYSADAQLKVTYFRASSNGWEVVVVFFIFVTWDVVMAIFASVRAKAKPQMPTSSSRTRSQCLDGTI